MYIMLPATARFS